MHAASLEYKVYYCVDAYNDNNDFGRRKLESEKYVMPDYERVIQKDEFVGGGGACLYVCVWGGVTAINREIIELT